jgi:hypothetical protein
MLFCLIRCNIFCCFIFCFVPLCFIVLVTFVYKLI